MKILICRITDSGVVLRSKNLIQALIHSGHDIIIATPKETAFQDLIDLGCKYIEVKIQGHGKNLLADLSVYYQYIRILNTVHPDLALLYTTKPNIYCGMACRRLKIPVIMNITGMGTALGTDGILQKIMIQLYRMACNGDNMKTIFFQNDDSMQFFTHHKIGDSKLYKRLPGSGVDLDKFPLQMFPKSDTVDFLFVGRVMRQKGIDQYIEAARNVKKNHPEAVFHVLGGCDDKYRGILIEENQKGIIVYHGRVSDIQYYQKMSQCTIQPSFYPEGVSNVILEAAASGRPVITTDNPGCREGVDDGKTGFIVPVKDAEALTIAIEKFLSMSTEERKEMGLLGRKKMEHEFDQKFVTDSYLTTIFK